MRKYAGLRAAEIPEIIRALPALNYPQRLNSARALLEGALEKGFGALTAYHCNGRTFTYADVPGKCIATRMRCAGSASAKARRCCFGGRIPRN